MVKKKVVKKKVTRKKASKRSVSKKKPTRKTSKKAKPIMNQKVIEKKRLKTSKLLLTSVIIFVLSYSLYLLINLESIYLIFGFIAILSGSLILLSVILEVIFYLLSRKKK